MNSMEVLQEVHKGAQQGMESIGTISDKIGDMTLKKLLIYQHHEYKTILNKSQKIIEARGGKPAEAEPGTKLMCWMGIQMNTFKDKSNSQISDLLIQGNNMGIIKGNELLNHNPDIDENVRNLISEFVTLQEKNVDDLKKFL